MRVGIIQSNYIPWRGYFDFIDAVDLFVFHDDIQYTKGDWRNRNRIKTPNGARWLTVPVHYLKTTQLICESEIDFSKDWRSSHLNQFKTNYSGSPFLNKALRVLEEALAHTDHTISQLNIRLIKSICETLEITTPFAHSSDFDLEGTKTGRLIGLLRKVGADVYLSGPSARSYIDESLFRENDIGLEYKRYEYPEYPQLWGEFSGEVTVLDLIASKGAESKDYIKSLRADQVAVEKSVDR